MARTRIEPGKAAVLIVLLLAAGAVGSVAVALLLRAIAHTV
jgi:LPS O-antigen subunit length determinant protein (WzzB/FepE family)